MITDIMKINRATNKSVYCGHQYFPLIVSAFPYFQSSVKAYYIEGIVSIHTTLQYDDVQ
jgi:hypothetical protein